MNAFIYDCLHGMSNKNVANAIFSIENISIKYSKCCVQIIHTSMIAWMN